MSQENADGVDFEDGSQPLLVVAAAAAAGITYKPAGFRFRQLILGIRFVICLKRTRWPPVNQYSRTRSYTAVEVPAEDEREIKKQSLKRIVKDKDLKALQQEFGGVNGACSILEPQVTIANFLLAAFNGLAFEFSFS